MTDTEQPRIPDDAELAEVDEGPESLPPEEQPHSGGFESALSDAVSPLVPDEAVTAAEAPAPPDLDKLEYYQILHARHTLQARAVLLLVIFGMMAANMYLTHRNYETLVVTMDSARTTQSDMLEQQARLMEEQSNRLQAMDARLARIEAAEAGGSAVAEVGTGAR